MSLSRLTASGNTTNCDIAANNKVETIIVAPTSVALPVTAAARSWKHQSVGEYFLLSDARSFITSMVLLLTIPKDWSETEDMSRTKRIVSCTRNDVFRYLTNGLNVSVMQLSLSFATTLRTILFLFICAPVLFAQGPLNPPAGTPAPTMKSLQQIEPRIDVENDLPAPGVITNDSNYHFVINRAGSYYFSANLGVTKANGIQISAEGVTLDLEGFEISRVSGATGNGIEILATSHRATISHGTIKGFTRGIQSLEDATGFPQASGLYDVAVSRCTNTGIITGTGAILQACRAHDNSGTGFQVATASTLTECTATKNGSIGIFVGGPSSLLNCGAYSNDGPGISTAAGNVVKGCVANFNKGSSGISVGQNSIVVDCSALSNTSTLATSAGITTSTGCSVLNCTSANNASTAALTPTTGMGFGLGAGSMIRGCVAWANKGNGIRISASSIARDNQCDSNGNGPGIGAGIQASSTDNRIEGNNVTNNDRGIHIIAPGNLIIANSASGNTIDNYDTVAGNMLGTIVSTSAALNAAPNSAVNISF
jgi:parallel beta-helix repeat protein